MLQTVVNVEWDHEAEAWLQRAMTFLDSRPELTRLRNFVERLKTAIPEMLAENGIPLEAGIQGTLKGVPTPAAGRCPAS